MTKRLVALLLIIAAMPFFKTPAISAEETQPVTAAKEEKVSVEDVIPLTVGQYARTQDAL